MTLLVEDRRHETFGRALLARLGVETRSIRVEKAPPGEGAAEAFVRRRFPVEVESYRHRAGRAQTGLLAMTDADTLTVDQRKHLLDEQLDKGREANERIALLVPKWEIENWILFLTERRPNGADVVEDARYSFETIEREDVVRSASRFFELSRPSASLPRPCLPSIESAVPEAQRLRV